MARSGSAVLLAFACACGGDYYDKAPPAAPVAPVPKRDEGPKRPAYVLGKGVPEDVEDAAWAATLKCNGADAKACTELGKLVASNKWGSRDDKRAAELFSKGCGGGDPAACEDLGEAYMHGRGVPRDAEKGRELYDQACRGRRAYACGVLGAMVAAGYGVQRDFKRARVHLQHACEEGDSPSCELGTTIVACERGDKASCARIDQLKARYEAQDAASGLLDAGAGPTGPSSAP